MNAVTELKAVIELQNELLEVLIKSARRCAYDLGHAIDQIPAYDALKVMLHGKSDIWLEIFNPDGLKNYHSKLSNKITQQAMRNEKLVRILNAAGLSEDWIE